MASSTLSRLQAITGDSTSQKSATSTTSSPRRKKPAPAPAPAPINRNDLPELVVRPRTQLAQLISEGSRIAEQIKLLESQLAPIREQLLKQLKAKNGRCLIFGDIVVDRKFRAKWTYSVKTRNEMLRIKNLQEVEQRTGIARNNPLEHTAFRRVAAPRNQESL